MDLTAGFVPKQATPVLPSHPAGEVTAFDEKTGLPIVKRAPEKKADKTPDKPADKKPDNSSKKPESTKSDSTSSTSPDVGKQETDPAPEPDIFDHVASGATDEPPAKDAPVSFAKGQAVELPDGTPGKITYLSHQLNVARVRTDDGRKITLGHRQLKQLKGKPKT